MRFFIWAGVVILFVGGSIQGVRFYRDWIIHRRCAELFDADYYVARYPEVKSSRLSPFKHYMTVGYKEMKNPYAMFDAAFYCKTYCYEPWFVTKRPKNPLMVYAWYGEREGHVSHPSLVRMVMPLDNPTYYLCVVAMFRDEAPYLREWIEYYLMMGVEHFFLTNHWSKDNYKQVLQPYIDRGLVTLYEVPISDKRHFDVIKIEAYDAAVNHLRDKSEWLAIIDTDEFAMPVKDDDLVSVLRRYDHCPGVFFEWKCFGTSGVTLKEGDLIIEKLIKCEVLEDQKHYSFYYKCFVKPRFVVKVNGNHWHELLQGCLYAGPVSPKPRLHHTAIAWEPWHKDSCVFLYHYTLRDERFFKKVKAKRFSNYKESNKLFVDFYKNKYEQVIDTSMHRFVPELKKRMAASASSPDHTPAKAA